MFAFPPPLPGAYHSGMSDENDCRAKQREITASAIVVLAICAIALMAAVTDWLIPKILGSGVVVLIGWAAVRIGIRTWRDGFK